MPVSSEARIERWTALDRKVVQGAKSVRVLSALAWPAEALEGFLRSFRAGNPVLPKVDIAPRHLDTDELEALIDSFDRAAPIERYLRGTAVSYVQAAQMLRVVGTKEFFDRSAALYGSPYDRLPGSSLTHLDAADQLLIATEGFERATLHQEPTISIDASSAAEQIRARVQPFFREDDLPVVVDSSLAARAAAGANRIRLRGNTTFSELDIDQLIEHEAFVHSGTARNGKSQPILTSMGLGAPRTTLTQEGLATVAELMTRALDITRLRRIALRIRAVHLALSGADFLDVFRYFLANRQSEEESVRSAMRIFRGGKLTGRWVFTKDVVYLQGMIAVHVFLRKAIAQRQPHLIQRLFAGRQSLADLFELEEAYSHGWIVPPAFVPRWARNIRALAAQLAFSAVVYRMDLGSVDIERILPTEHVSELGESDRAPVAK